ncbi:hypothetical protein [Streptomyces stelliscabiei]
MNRLAAHGALVASPRPVTPVPSSRTARTVPQALKRPARSWVAPTKAAA